MSPFINLRQILSHMLPKPLKVLIPFIIFIDFMKCGKVSLVHIEKVLRKTSIPTLIIHSKDDNMVPYESSTMYLEKHLINQYLSYYIVDQKKHNPDYTLDALAYTSEVMKKLQSLPKIEQEEYRKTLDYHRMGALDLDVLVKIEEFLKK